MFDINLENFKYKDGFYFILTFMHGDADYDTISHYYIENKIVARDFCNMLCEIKGSRTLPMNHLYWLNELKQEAREDLEYLFEDEEVVDKILNSHLPDDNKFLTEDIIQQVNFKIPFDDIRYTNYLAKLTDVDITFVLNGFSYDVRIYKKD